MEIRPAIAADAEAASALLRQSIRELCVADHGHDPAILDRWLANKTPEQFRAWLKSPGLHVLVATEGEARLAVGSVSSEGRIGLNYVAPAARFRGVSKAMLAALEDQARRAGATRCTLESTVTAQRFYRAAGYVETGPTISQFGTASIPMARALAG
ncbi:GNAT family N-acetyltransferase [Roseomonas sp. HJA6]|uniref:GNAT family N-acetyltransferase n=1 Tax=Roseomonas alba TaxID=2846776 RepID=A0ABS7A2I2_9PROT|nr:GNAT family N-acetyltransferase [Neoroseomonas alba]MBW6396504.1 GNAT family N-acetyltransferase [Neoroseomonas alba]